ncbi:hypothetical protein [Opitutus sp. GAS368]|nr:hypothetical protein [Opitutus sp. GAS368]SDS48857.1 hypothetical protein SAMN05444173_3041 [Opitutus sp. GAS368]
MPSSTTAWALTTWAFLLFRLFARGNGALPATATCSEIRFIAENF